MLRGRDSDSKHHLGIKGIHPAGTRVVVGEAVAAWQGVLESSEEKWHLSEALSMVRKVVMCLPGKESSRLRNSKCKGPGAGAYAGMLEE